MSLAERVLEKEGVSLADKCRALKLIIEMHGSTSLEGCDAIQALVILKQEAKKSERTTQKPVVNLADRTLRPIHPTWHPGQITKEAEE